MNHRISRFNTFRLAPLALVATSAIAARPAEAGLLGISEQDEIRAGQQVAAQAEKQYGRRLRGEYARRNKSERRVT